MPHFKTGFRAAALLAVLITPCLAAGEQKEIIFYEIAWMGTEKSPRHEWIELKNNTAEEINLEGWTLKARDGSPRISLSNTIAAHGYFLLERTSEETLPHLFADQIYTGALGNSGEKLELYDRENEIIDVVDCSNGWLNGDNETKQTMEKSSDGQWQTSAISGGTPKEENSAGQQKKRENPNQLKQKEAEPENPPIFSSEEKNTSINRPPQAQAGPDLIALVGQNISFDASNSYDPENELLNFFWSFGDGASQEGERVNHIYHYPGQYLASLFASDGILSDTDIISINVYQDSIIINEAMPNPKGSDDREWLELFNQSENIANLSGWTIDDREEGSSPFVFPENTFLGPQQFLVLKKETTKLSFNNEQDQIRLFYPNNSLACEINYRQSAAGSSLSFDGRDYHWTNQPTPGSKNIITSHQPLALIEENRRFSVKKSKETPSFPQGNLSLAKNQEDKGEEKTSTSSTSMASLTGKDSAASLSLHFASLNQNTANKKNLLPLALSASGAGLAMAWLAIKWRKWRKTHPQKIFKN